jgi:competence ComEA-like helix-hairpin-helix protein
MLTRRFGSLTARLGVVALLVSMAGAEPVAGQGGSQGLFSISPSRRDVVARPVTNLSQTAVTNTTGVPFRVKIFPALLGQVVTGSFTFDEIPVNLTAAAKILSPNPATFTLAPGETRQVGATWALLPRHTRAAYVGLIYQGTPQGPHKGPVRTIDRLLQINLLRLPGRYHPRGKFVQLRSLQGVGRTLEFVPRMQNTGDVVAAPRAGRLQITDSGGQAVVRQKWQGDVILPRALRDFPIQVNKVLPAGRYTVTTTASFGHSRHLRITEPFQLVGPNRLPTPRIELRGLAAHGTIGKSSEVSADLASVGSIAASTAVRVSLYRLSNSNVQPAKPNDTRKLRFDAIAPGDTKALKVTYQGLPKGRYRVLLTFHDTPGSTQTQTIEFTPEKQRGFFDRLDRWFQNHKTLALLLLALLVIAAVVAFFVRRQSRLKRELEAARGEDSAPAVPATAGAGHKDDRVDLNNGSVEELQALPGVGPAAAQRIVAHREEYGAFESVDDLAKVEGFDADRVAQLRAMLHA